MNETNALTNETLDTEFCILEAFIINTVSNMHSSDHKSVTPILRLYHYYSRRHKKVPVPYSCYDCKMLRSVKRYDPFTVQIVITVVRNRAVYTGK